MFEPESVAELEIVHLYANHAGKRWSDSSTGQWVFGQARREHVDIMNGAEAKVLLETRS